MPPTPTGAHLPFGSQTSGPVVLLMSPEPSEGSLVPVAHLSLCGYSPLQDAPTEFPPVQPTLAKGGR